MLQTITRDFFTGVWFSAGLGLKLLGIGFLISPLFPRMSDTFARRIYRYFICPVALGTIIYLAFSIINLTKERSHEVSMGWNWAITAIGGVILCSIGRQMGQDFANWKGWNIGRGSLIGGALGLLVGGALGLIIGMK